MKKRQAADKEFRRSRIAAGNVITAVIAATIILLSFYWSYVRCQNTDFRHYDNEARIQTSEHAAEIEAGNYEKYRCPYLVCDLAGKVLYADEEFGVMLQDTVNVQELLQTDKSFGAKQPDIVKKSFVIRRGGSVAGFAVYLIPIEQTKEMLDGEEIVRCILPGIVGVLLVFLMLAFRMVYCNRRILMPIREIAVSARHIIQGNYEYEFVRIFSNRVNADEVGELICSFELMRDELKSKQIREEELKKAQQELISCISHDLKTPISTIKAYAEGLRDGIAQDETAREDYIRIMIEKTNLLINMIEDLLHFSNAQLNQLTIVRKELYFKKFFEKAMDEIRIFVEQKNLQFEYRVDLKERIVTIDEKRIMEVLYNLVENSIKYSRAGGRIEISAVREDEQVLIRVADNGTGIASDDIPYIFDKFYRAEKSRSSSIPGSGLGLSICKYIVEKHGGTIYCKSRKEKGCEIGFTIE